MKLRSVMIVALSAMACVANAQQQQDIPLPPPLQATTGRPWLGLKLSKVDASIRAQLQALPAGVGFVVRAVEGGGPAEAAKFQPYDVVWKMGDQLIINEAQLATLLLLHQPGDEIVLSIFRGGQPMEVGMKLGDLPIGKDGFSSELAEAAILPGTTGPMRVVNLSDRTATYSTNEGKVVLRKEGDAYFVTINNPKEEIIFQGDVTTQEASDAIPELWRHKVSALRRGLDHQLKGYMEPVRAPRPRVVPAAEP